MNRFLACSIKSIHGRKKSPQAPQAAPEPALSLPVACVPGKTCWIAQFVDLDPGPGVRDYMCAGRANNGHTGVDIAVRDMAAMKAGMVVRAAAPGVVLAARDGVPDISVRETGNENMSGSGCGNGVAISIGGGWGTPPRHTGALQGALGHETRGCGPPRAGLSPPPGNRESQTQPPAAPHFVE